MLLVVTATTGERLVVTGERLAPLWPNHGGIAMTSTPVRDTRREVVWGSIVRQDLGEKISNTHIWMLG